MFILKDVTYKDILHIPYLQIQKRKKSHVLSARVGAEKAHCSVC